MASRERLDRLLVERMATLERQRERIQAALGKIQQCVDCKVTPGTHNNYCEPCRLTGEPLPETISALY